MNSEIIEPRARGFAKQAGLSMLALATMLAAAGTAQAQQATPAAPEAAQAPSDAQAVEEEIIVTGTLLRGVAPTGTNVIGINRDTITARGVTSSNDLLAKIPQIGNFGTVPTGTPSFGLPVIRPNIRNLGASGGSTTLVLINGHRGVGAGILQTTVDPSILPPDILERVEVVPDGGSAIYGSDAIGGVVNFITRKRFDGVSANLRYGFADDYHSVDGSLTAGKDWGSGSLFVAYAYAKHDDILGIDRDYTSADRRSKGGGDFRVTTCAPGNIQIGATSYALPARTAGTVNKCDQNAYASIFPREERHSVFASLTQHLDGAVTFSATAYWSRRDTTSREAQGMLSGTISLLNPNFRTVAGELQHNVSISFADVFGNSLTSHQRFDSYGVTPGFSFALGKGWQLRAESNFGRSQNLVRQAALDTTTATLALAGLIPGMALNPYNLAASSPAALAAIRNYENYGDATQELAEGRLILDGSLAHLAGGDIRLAVGAEYHAENISSRISQGAVGAFANVKTSRASRDVRSAFGELLVPIVGAGNGSAGLRGLQLSASVRYDDYSDQGGTTNPKIGVNYKPFTDLTIRGNWGTSFHAPSLADTTNTSDSRATVLPFSPFLAPGALPTDPLRSTIVLAGGNPNLKPERADTWSAGFDWTPRAVPGLVANLTYYNVKFKEAIGLAPFLSPTLFTNPNYASFYTLSPTLAQAQARVGSLAVVGAPSIASLYAGPLGPYVIIDARRNNLGAVNTDGLDFNLAYTRLTGFGAINASIAGTYTLNRKSQAVSGGAFADDLKNGVGRTAFVATLGGKSGGFIASASYNYKGGFPILGVMPQTRVGAFQTVDAFLAYDLGTHGFLKNAMLTLNVDNIFDRDPPWLNSAAAYTNGSTLGRLVTFGIRTKF
ncbi:iron complex outermembrane receptor protein [Sphingomonas kyeonggiensis]|uniref:TonB-dependent receptor domain-containing protein n=1 Tax=Sphingomonas kyeonggiensis TaxID=1268553 RepID=UPI002785ED93|nr:TonB-dependent receptor [Sphingomonas kyeonggiensis]MDQ0252622.1 iron complex outermembrane receptor protein [Sphingomonas kyeonggiensis]